MNQLVIDHCNNHKLCKGCKVNCSAPATGNYDVYAEWSQRQEIKILAYIKNGEANV
jgi:hypothetical protein